MSQSVWSIEGLWDFVVELFKDPNNTYDDISRMVEQHFGVQVGADAIRKKLSKSGFKKRYAVSTITNYDFEFQVFTNLKPHKNHVLLFNLADIHIGDCNADLNAVKEFIAWVRKTPNAYGFVSGDVINIITKDSVGNVYTQKEPPDEQIEQAIQILYPIKSRILKIIGGNHEARAIKSVGIDPIREIATRLGVPYGQYILCSIVFSEDVWYSIFGLHKLTNSLTDGALVNNLKKMSNQFLCDIYFGAHSHRIVASKDRTFVVYKDKIIEQQCTYVSTGAFVKYNGYPILGKMKPALIGEIPIVKLETNRKSVTVVL